MPSKPSSAVTCLRTSSLSSLTGRVRRFPPVLPLYPVHLSTAVMITLCCYHQSTFPSLALAGWNPWLWALEDRVQMVYHFSQELACSVTKETLTIYMRNLFTQFFLSNCSWLEEEKFHMGHQSAFYFLLFLLVERQSALGGWEKVFTLKILHYIPDFPVK